MNCRLLPRETSHCPLGICSNRLFNASADGPFTPPSWENIGLLSASATSAHGLFGLLLLLKKMGRNSDSASAETGGFFYQTAVDAASSSCRPHTQESCISSPFPISRLSSGYILCTAKTIPVIRTMSKINPVRSFIYTI